DEQAKDDKADVGAEQESDGERSGDDAPMTLPEHQQQPSLSSAADTRPNRVGPTASMAIPTFLLRCCADSFAVAMWHGPSCHLVREEAAPCRVAGLLPSVATSLPAAASATALLQMVAAGDEVESAPGLARQAVAPRARQLFADFPGPNAVWVG